MEIAPVDKLKYLGIGDELMAKLAAIAIYLIKCLLADEEYHHVLNQHPPQGEIHRKHIAYRQNHGTNDSDNQQPSDNERYRRPKPCRHLHLRNLLHRIHHRSRINLFHLAIHHFAIRSLASVLFAKCQEFHPPVFAFSSQFLLQIPSSFDILHAQRRFPGKIPGECLRTARCDGSADAVEQRTLAENIEVEGIRMLRILIGIARLERREIALQSLDFVLINLEQSRKMLYLLLVLVVNSSDSQIGNQAQHCPHQIVLRISIQCEIADQEGEDAAKSQQLARYESRILTLQGSHLRSVSAYILLIILLDIHTFSLFFFFDVQK